MLRAGTGTDFSSSLVHSVCMYVCMYVGGWVGDTCIYYPLIPCGIVYFSVCVCVCVRACVCACVTHVYIIHLPVVVFVTIFAPPSL